MQLNRAPGQAVLSKGTGCRGGGQGALPLAARVAAACCSPRQAGWVHISQARHSEPVLASLLLPRFGGYRWETARDGGHLWLWPRAAGGKQSKIQERDGVGGGYSFRVRGSGMIPKGRIRWKHPELWMPTMQQGLKRTFISRLALLDGRDPKIGGEKAPQELIYPVPLQPGRDLAAKHM